MTRRILLPVVMSGMLLLTMTPAPLAAQTAENQILYACYIPFVGVVYRIKAPGLPTACLGKSHVEFQWNAQGIKGDRGDTGPAGNLALAGQNCPVGFFVAGFSTTGGLTCRNLAGDEPTPLPPPPPPPPPPPHPSLLTGNWTFTPTLTSSCKQAFTTVGSIVLSGMTTSGTVTDLAVQPVGGFQIGPFSGRVSFAPAIFPTTDPLTFPVSLSMQGTTPPFSGPIAGTIDYDVSGQFTGLTSFSGSVNLTFHLTYSGFPLTCDPLVGNVTATRAP